MWSPWALSYLDHVDARCVPLLPGDVLGGPAFLVGQSEAGLALHQQGAHDLRVAVAARAPERRLPILVGVIHIGLAVRQEDPDNRQVAVRRCGHEAIPPTDRAHARVCPLLQQVLQASTEVTGQGVQLSALRPRSDGQPPETGEFKKPYPQQSIPATGVDAASRRRGGRSIIMVSHSTGYTHLDDLGVAVMLDQAGPVERRVPVGVDEAQVCPPLHQQPD